MMGLEQPVAVNVRIEESAKRVLGALGSNAKVLVTVESTLYGGCCGAYEEKSLKVVVESAPNLSDFVLLGEKIPIYVNKEAIALIESRGGHFAIYAGLDGSLYSDQ